jgi:hypothetical protein
MHCLAFAQSQAGCEKTKPGQRNSIHWTHKAFCGGNPFDLRFVFRKKRVRFPASKPPLV